MSLSLTNTVIKRALNQRNIRIVKLLSFESLFDGYQEDLIHIYGTLLTIKIECIAVFIEKNSIERYLFIKLSNGDIHQYQMDKTKRLNETYQNFTQSISQWMDDRKQLQYYRRFTQDFKINEAMRNNQLMKIKSK